MAKLAGHTRLDHLPNRLIRQAVLEFLEQNKGALADHIVERIGPYAAQLFNDVGNMRTMVTLERQDDLRRELTDLTYVASGQCPECHQLVKNWMPPTGAFAPEMWATMKEQGIDPATGHKITCSATTHPEKGR